MAHTITADCTGCLACLRQCPTEAITGARDALHVITPALCVDCGVCGFVCADAAVLDAAGALVPRLPRDRRPRPIFDETLCNGCALCVEFCPFDCIEVLGPRYLGRAWLSEPMRCVSCSECELICIKGAVRMEPIPLRQLDPTAALARLRALAEAES